MLTIQCAVSNQRMWSDILIFLPLEDCIGQLPFHRFPDSQDCVSITHPLHRPLIDVSKHMSCAEKLTQEMMQLKNLTQPSMILAKMGIETDTKDSDALTTHSKVSEFYMSLRINQNITRLHISAADSTTQHWILSIQISRF